MIPYGCYLNIESIQNNPLLKLRKEHIVRFTEPHYYSISVSNAVPNDVIDIMTNFYEEKPVCKKRNNYTVIKGLIKDQAALSGLLGYLSDLHYIIFSVKAL